MSLERRYFTSAQVEKIQRFVNAMRGSRYYVSEDDLAYLANLKTTFLTKKLLPSERNKIVRRISNIKRYVAWGLRFNGFNHAEIANLLITGVGSVASMLSNQQEIIESQHHVAWELKQRGFSIVGAATSMGTSVVVVEAMIAHKEALIEQQNKLVQEKGENRAKEFVTDVTRLVYYATCIVDN